MKSFLNLKNLKKLVKIQIEVRQKISGKLIFVCTVSTLLSHDLFDTQSLNINF